MNEHHSFNFTREPKSVRAARGALDALRGRLPEARLYEASLCLSELVSNAIQHPAPEGGSFELTVGLGDDVLRVEVADPGSGFEPGRPTRGDVRGWGLFIVDRLATRWGADPGERTRVWFEIAIGEVAVRARGSADTVGRSRTAPRDDRLLRATALRRARRLA